MDHLFSVISDTDRMRGQDASDNLSFHVDNSKYAPATIRSSLCHLRLIKRNGYQISQFKDGNALNILNKLKNRKGELLTNSHKRQVAFAIQKVDNSIKIDTKQFGKHRQEKVTRMSDAFFLDHVKKMVTNAAEYLGRHITQEVSDLAMLEACAAVLFSVCTALRIDEICQLQYDHLDRIKEGEPINISCKGKSSAMRTIPNSDILASLIHTLVLIKPKVEKCVAGSDAQIHIIAHWQLKKDFVIKTSQSFMRKKLKELSALTTVEDDQPKNDWKEYKLGFQSFRKYITTILVENGGHLVAQALNNHKNLVTTLTHYTNPTPQTAEDTMNRLYGSTHSKWNDEDFFEKELRDLAGSPSPSGTSSTVEEELMDSNQPDANENMEVEREKENLEREREKENLEREREKIKSSRRKQLRRKHYRSRSNTQSSSSSSDERENFMDAHTGGVEE